MKFLNISRVKFPVWKICIVTSKIIIYYSKIPPMYFFMFLNGLEKQKNQTMGQYQNASLQIYPLLL